MKWTEITGAELYKPFKVDGLEGNYVIIELCDRRGRLIEVASRAPSGDNKAGCSLTPNEFCAIIHAAPSGIIHLPPPLTDEQREQLKALYTLGYRWLVKNEHCQVNAFEERPSKFEHNYYWLSESGRIYYCSTKPSDCLASLVSWSDPEPYDIGKALGVGE